MWCEAITNKVILLVQSGVNGIMALGNIVIGSTTFIDTGKGRYIDSASTVGGLRNELKISPGVLAKKAVPPTLNAAITRLQEKSVVVNTVTSVKRGSATISIAMEPGFTPADVDALVADLSTYITVGTLNLILNGAS
jgi:hypothetical protein